MMARPSWVVARAAHAAPRRARRGRRRRADRVGRLPRPAHGARGLLDLARRRPLRGRPGVELPRLVAHRRRRLRGLVAARRRRGERGDDALALYAWTWARRDVRQRGAVAAPAGGDRPARSRWARSPSRRCWRRWRAVSRRSAPGSAGSPPAIRLAAAGHAVVGARGRPRAPGGKCGRVARDGFTWDSGPSLLTMPWVLEALFADTGAPLADELELLPVEPVTRYRFADGTRLRPVGRSPSGRAPRSRPGGRAPARSGTRFLATCAGMWRASEAVLAARRRGRRAAAARRAAALAARPRARASRGGRCARSPARTPRDPRLRMVIERFATYAGADPRRAPAALAVAGYVEHAWGAWHPRGGLYALVEALVRRLAALGGELRTGDAGAADRAGARRAAVAAAAAGRRARRARAGGLIGRAARVSGRRDRRRRRPRGRGRRRARRRDRAPRPARPAAARRASARSPASR